MEKKRKTELDLDLKVEDLLEEEKPSPAEPEKAEEPEEKEPGFLQKLIDRLNAIPPKFFILAGSGVLVFILITGIIVYFSLKPAPVTEKPVEKPAPSFKKVPQYEFTPFFFPIKAKNNKEVFLKIAFSFDLSNELVLNEIEQNIALLRANLSFVLKKKSLSDIESDSGKTKIGQEIINILNRSLQKGTAVKIYFTQFLLK